MKLEFYKYQGAGNDFIIIDNREGSFQPEEKVIAHLCHRRFGAGADGLMLLETSVISDFRMRYYNSDGREGSMCGNGGRCIAAFAYKLGLTGKEAFIETTDGEHHAIIIAGNDLEIQVKLSMKDVGHIEFGEDYFFLDTGSPHHVMFVNDLKSFDVVKEGRRIRNSDKYKAKGTNVDFAEAVGGNLFVRSYERGVEDETLSCGTGVTATAIAWSCMNPGIHTVTINTPGGILKVSFKKNGDHFSDICLEGPARFVYKGSIDLI